MAQIPNMNWMGDQPTGSAYDVYQYYLGGGGPGGTPTGGGGGGTGITSLPLYPPTRGRDGGYQGGGKWGNLDLKDTKMFDKNVFSVDMSRAPPGMEKMTGSFKPEQVQGYYNPQTGHYQTLEGKNINHLGLNIKPAFASILESMGGKKKSLFEHDLGDTEGTFTHGWKSGKGKIKEGWEDEKDKWSQIFGQKKRKAKKEAKLQKEIKDYNKKMWDKVQKEKKDDAAKKSTYTGPKTYAFDEGQARREGRRADKPDGHTDPGKGSYGPHKAQGGMIKDLTKDPEYRGWKKMYEMNPEVGSMHDKHPTFIKFYKQHERDQKKFGGLAGLLYG
jgi:hypothetical protein